MSDDTMIRLVTVTIEVSVLRSTPDEVAEPLAEEVIEAIGAAFTASGAVTNYLVEISERHDVDLNVDVIA